MAVNVSLTVNRALLDPNFESYRLSLDPIPTYSVQLQEGVDEVELSEDLYTRDHVRVYGMRNHLVADPWDATSVYYVDRAGRVQRVRVALDTYLGTPVPVFRLAREVAGSPGRVSTSMHFLSEERAALCDGAGTLLVLHTGARAVETDAAWEVVYSGAVSTPSLVVDGLQRAGAAGAVLELLLLRVERDPAPSSKSGFHSALEWLTLEPDEGVVGPARFSVSRRRELAGPSAPFYVALEPWGAGIVVAADRALRVTSDSARPVAEEEEEEQVEVKEEEEEEKEEEEKELGVDDVKAPPYQWQQTSEDVTVTFDLPEDTPKGDVEVTVTPERLEVGVKGGATLLRGELAGRADPEGSAWTWSPGRLELTLMKAEPSGDWAELLAGGVGGANGANGATQGDDFERRPVEQVAYNPQQLEECDAAPEEMATLCRIDGDSHARTYTVNLGGHQFLFTAQLAAGDMPGLCLRHDVDALLWRPRPQDDARPWEHLDTFNALGYVQASKQERKFLACAPGRAFAALCECSRRVFLYRQPAASPGTQLRKRGRPGDGRVARQQVATLEAAGSEPFLGFVVTDERVFLLTQSKLLALRVTETAHG